MSVPVLNEKKRARVAALRRRHEWLVRIAASKQRGGRDAGRELEEAKALQWVLEVVAEKYGSAVVKPVDASVMVPLLAECASTTCDHFERCGECGRGQTCQRAPHDDDKHDYRRAS